VRLCSADDGQGGVEIRWDGAALTVAGVPVELPAGPERSLDLHIFLDKSILEVFADGGRVAMTRVVYPAAGDQAVAVFAEGGAAHIARLDAWQMQGIW
jgi:sucrose-6-phosphate hydrolase SacC (GH32 family)